MACTDKKRTLEHFYDLSEFSIIWHMFHGYKTKLRLLENLLRTSSSNKQTACFRDIIKVFELRSIIDAVSDIFTKNEW
jgi:hypothetical protein